MHGVPFLITVLLLLSGNLLWAQNRNITLSLKGAPLEQLIRLTEQQTDYRFVYESHAIDPQRPVSVEVKNADINTVLSSALRGTEIGWTISGNKVLLSPKSPAAQQAADPVSGPASGRVSDHSGEPVIGCGVLVKGTTRGAVTDQYGRFSIPGVRSGDTLVFTSLGFETAEIVWNGVAVDLELEEDAHLLEDAVVIGYGTQSRKTLTSSISKVDGDKITGAPVSSVGEALKGKVTGLRIASSSNLAGDTPRFLIRGGSSINRSNDALTLVDGVQQEIGDLNPNDIESIEVFKDAASSAIYGARASNGVIVVTTKKGNAYKQPQIVFDSQMGVIGPSRLWDMADATEFINIVRPAAQQGPNASTVLNGANGAGVGNTSPTDIYSTRYLKDGESVPAGYLSMPDPIDPSKTIIYSNQDVQRGWFRNVFYQKQYLGVNGGDKNIKYAASIGYLGDEGMLPTNSFENFTMHGNTTFKVTKTMEVSTTFDLSQGTQQPTTNNYFAAIGRGLMMSPTHIGKYPDGTFATGGNNKNQQTPEFYSTFFDRERQSNRIRGSINLKWDMTDWLSANAKYSYSDANHRGSYYKIGEVDGTPNYVDDTRVTKEDRSETNLKSLLAYLQADKKLNQSRISATLGFDWNKWHYENLSAENSGSLSDKIPYLGSGGDNTSGTMSMGNSRYETALLSYFLRGQYNFADRYILMGTIRADGSSLFLGKNKWGFFPSASAAWLISEEPFFEPWKEKMNMFKLRVSYGQTGNNNIDISAPLGAYTQSNYAGFNTIRPAVMQNRDLRWETTTQLDLGADLGFLNDRIRVVLDYYNKVTKDLIFSVTLPDTAQLTSVMDNVGSIRFYGAELELHTVNIDRRNFRWSTDFTYSYNRNVVLSLPEEYKYEIVDVYGNPTGEYGYRIGGTVTASGYRFGGIAVGEPLGRMWGYKIAGILQTEEQAAAAYYDPESAGYRRSDGLSIQGRKDVGDFEWVNRKGTALAPDGSEQIDATDIFCLGNVMPHSIGGINNTINWGRFTFNLYCDYALGHTIYNYMKTRMMQNTLGYCNSNIDMTLFKAAWRKPGDKTNTARFFPNDTGYGNQNYSRGSEWNKEKADYLCIRDASIYYDLPDKWAQALKMKKFTVGVTGNTLYFFTGVSGAISPETGMSTAVGADMYAANSTANEDGNMVPATRKILFNVKLTF